MTVRDNVAFGLKVRKRRKAEIRDRVDELLKLVQLEASGIGTRPALGGQRQRMALARALAPEPGVLLLDEPFGALDARVRAELRDWLRALHEEVHVTTIFVTHDQAEAMDVAEPDSRVHEPRTDRTGRHANRAVRPARHRVRDAASSVRRTGLVELGSAGATGGRPRSRTATRSRRWSSGSRSTASTRGWSSSGADGEALTVQLTRERLDELELSAGKSCGFGPGSASSPDPSAAERGRPRSALCRGPARPRACSTRPIRLRAGRRASPGS